MNDVDVCAEISIFSRITSSSFIDGNKEVWLKGVPGKPGNLLTRRACQSNGWFTGHGIFLDLADEIGELNRGQ